MASESYKEQLLNPLWKAKRLEILKRDRYICTKCSATAEERLLHVHHRYYLPNKMAWEYDDIVLITLCDACHKFEELRLEYYAKDLIELLKQYGAMASQLEELMHYFIAIGSIETIIHVLHEHWRKNILIDTSKQRLFGSLQANLSTKQ